MQDGTLLAALDLGSNSFRLEIGRYSGGHIERVEYLKETVRLGAGLDDTKTLSADAMARGWACLARFAEKLRTFERHQVRAVATQTLREARNRDVFLERAQAILGFPIDVIAGHEEARLIYQGVSHLLPQSDERRLVVDIGGRSTEMILGQGYRPLRMESYGLGSVAWSQRYFPAGRVTEADMRTAVVAAKAVLDQALDVFPSGSWDAVYASSGTAGALTDILGQAGFELGVITREGMQWIVQRLVRAGNVHELRLDGLKDDRRPVLAGGLSVLLALFELFDWSRVHRAQGALRQGALYDLIDRASDQTDVRERTVRWLAQKFAVDTAQAERVGRVATRLFEQVARPDPRNGRYSQKLAWAAHLHEIGAHISHTSAHRHGAYILDHVDAPGFSLPELHRMSLLVLGQRGKLRKLEAHLDDELFVKQLLCLRLAVLLCHARKDPDIDAIRLSYVRQIFRFQATSGWAQQYPQSAWLLQEEAQHWARTPWRLQLALP
ncbi:Ppx/GppA phosphatase family protein [Tepidimonas charontis]|uniref:Guanosine-5'-triphosphate,3'-diphosphate pyrophosphatase n=1 Tax=Tepidimonas charontis TaxID=2267262 RepID=A0A554XGT8_9BURK|nr:Ppx/GppA phosphatase family protein [Tepidimonas charontis]TSE35050.1 Guanosine-5'-triphosphate,3'-diphosphate pyrophosphatase [Tepidimonas charontis]